MRDWAGVRSIWWSNAHGHGYVVAWLARDLELQLCVCLWVRIGAAQPLRDDARGFSRPCVCVNVCVCMCVSCLIIAYTFYLLPISLLCLTHMLVVVAVRQTRRQWGRQWGNSCIRRANLVRECACASKSNLHPSVSQTTTNWEQETHTHKKKLMAKPKFTVEIRNK